jgi:predicted nucleic acid-binding protein
VRLILDTNVLLDFLLEREGFAESSTEVVRAVERKAHEGFVSPTSLSTVHYFLRKAKGDEEARACLRDLLRLFSVAPIDQQIVASALEKHGGDFEDHVIAEAARAAGAHAVVTRDSRGFAGSGIDVLSPSELLSRGGTS